MYNKAFINGFLKRAADYGVSTRDALFMYKQATQEGASISATPPGAFHIPLGQGGDPGFPNTLQTGLRAAGNAVMSAPGAIANAGQAIGNTIGSRFQNLKDNVGVGIESFGKATAGQAPTQGLHFDSSVGSGPMMRQAR